MASGRVGGHSLTRARLTLLAAERRLPRTSMYGTLVQHRPWASDVFPPPLDALLAARPAAWCCQWMSCCPCPPTSISCRSIRASMDAFHPTSALPMGSRSNPCATGKVRVSQAGSRYRSWYEQVRHAQHRLASALACPGRDSMRVMYPSYLGNNQRLMSIAPGRVGRLASACRHLPAVVPSLSTHTPWVGDGEPLTHTTSRSLRSNSQEWGQSNAAKELGHSEPSWQCWPAARVWLALELADKTMGWPTATLLAR